MKTISLFLFSLFSILIHSQKHDLEITITGFEKSGGNVFVAIYDSETTFLKKQKYGIIKHISGDKITVVFNDLPSGTYAVSCFYDANKNGKMDTKMFGIPKEQYGTSNGAKGFMGPPKYSDAKFELTENKSIKIKLN
jgi:uncharacterized protein (DUF2141 family)